MSIEQPNNVIDFKTAKEKKEQREKANEDKRQNLRNEVIDEETAEVDFKVFANEMTAELGPESSKYFLKEVVPKLTETEEEVSKAMEINDPYTAMDKAMELIEEVEGKVNKLVKKEPNAEKILSLVAAHLKIDQIIKAAQENMTGLKYALIGGQLLPVVGSFIIWGEGIAGQDSTGKKLSLGRRLLKAPEGAAFLAADLAGLVTGGTTTTGSTVAKGALKGGKLLNLVSKGRKAKVVAGTAKVIDKAGELKQGGKIVSIAKGEKAVDLAKTIESISQFTGKYPKLTSRLTETVAHLKKYPKTYSAAIEHFTPDRESIANNTLDKQKKLQSATDWQNSRKKAA